MNANTKKRMSALLQRTVVPFRLAFVPSWVDLNDLRPAASEPVRPAPRPHAGSSHRGEPLAGARAVRARTRLARAA